MDKHQYILEPYRGMNTRYHCPSCKHKSKTFALYIDTETSKHLHPTVGRCNRESNCGYHYTPKQYFQDNNISFDTPQHKAYKLQPIKPQPKPVSFIPVEAFKASLTPTSFEANHFVKFLISLFGANITNELVGRYFIGTSKHWDGATVFWQIDTQGKVRTGKIMLYNPITGKRVKEPFNHIQWVHKALRKPEFELRQCLFGEHLLIDKTKPVAIVESEKTAIIASVYFPQFIWLAAGNKDGLNAEKCSILKGRNIILFPDCSLSKDGKPTVFEHWSSKAKEFSQLVTFIISDLLERKATEAEKEQGLDLADYLIKFDFQTFRQSELISDNYSPLAANTSEANPNEIYLMWYKWYKNTDFIGLFEFYEFVLGCGGEIQAKTKILQYTKDTIIKGYPTEKLNTWLTWIESPENIPHPKIV
jgi:hypothetical protein